jgi:choline transport protein
MIIKRFSGERINFGPWNLGRYGLSVNIFAAIYTLVTVIFTFFPPSLPVDAVTMNYSCVVYGGVVILGLIYYAIRGHKTFVGPNIELDTT